MNMTAVVMTAGSVGVGLLPIMILPSLFIRRLRPQAWVFLTLWSISLVLLSIVWMVMGIFDQAVLNFAVAIDMGVGFLGMITFGHLWAYHRRRGYR